MVEEVECIGGQLDDLRDFDEVLYRDNDGNFYLRQIRELKMPPNADRLYWERIRCAEGAERQKLIAWKRRLTKPQITVKRISEKTALLWCIHQLLEDAQIKARLREVISVAFANKRET
jgi:hypothetical protein